MGGPSVGKERITELRTRAMLLRKAYIDAQRFRKRWTWPKRMGMDTEGGTKVAPPNNTMPYIPSKSADGDESHCAG